MTTLLQESRMTSLFRPALAALILCAPLAAHAAAPAKEKFVVLHDMGGAPHDGGRPWANMVRLGGTLYGTAAGGGSAGKGAVIELTPDGQEHVVYSFAGGSDGDMPLAGLAVLNGVLYGTTKRGGTFGRGTVFALTPDGSETVLHSFGGDGDGSYPLGGLAVLGGRLYGTLYAGPQGAVFSITTDGHERLIHNFGASGDGYAPAGALIAWQGALWGTTELGGDARQHYGFGTVFTVTPAGLEHVVYRFKGQEDGAFPRSALVQSGGTLYGVTSAGGGSPNCADGCGTVFAVTPDGTERVLHTFAGAPQDGSFPYAGLRLRNNVFYGTTAAGGANGAGTIFSVTAEGSFSTLYDFQGGLGGESPYGALVPVGKGPWGAGGLVGTTLGGGAAGEGTVYLFRP